MIRLRDCDVAEPLHLDDEYITHDGLLMPPAGTECRMSAFVYSIQMFMVLESVLDISPARPSASPFMQKAAALVTRSNGGKRLREEEALLDEIHRSLPPMWSQSTETLSSDDVIRLTQAERLHCAEHFVRMLINRHRFSETVAERAASGEGDEQQTEGEREAMIAAHASALEIARAHMHIAMKGLMTYCQFFLRFHPSVNSYLLCRWGACYSSANASWAYAGRCVAELQIGTPSAADTFRSGCLAHLYRAPPALQRTVYLWASFGRSHGRILSTYVDSLSRRK